MECKLITSAAGVLLKTHDTTRTVFNYQLTADGLVFTAPHRGRKTLADVQGRQLQEGPEEVRPSHRRPQEAADESLRRCGEGTESDIPVD